MNFNVLLYIKKTHKNKSIYKYIFAQKYENIYNY